MALFFDSQWFDARLSDAGLKRKDVAAALGLEESQLAEIWKDQRELSARDVLILSALMGVSREDVARHAGISTPVPGDFRADLEERLLRIEREIAEIRALLGERKTAR